MTDEEIIASQPQVPPVPPMTPVMLPPLAPPPPPLSGFGDPISIPITTKPFPPLPPTTPFEVSPPSPQVTEVVPNETPEVVVSSNPTSFNSGDSLLTRLFKLRDFNHLGSRVQEFESPEESEHFKFEITNGSKVICIVTADAEGIQVYDSRGISLPRENVDKTILAVEHVINFNSIPVTE